MKIPVLVWTENKNKCNLIPLIIQTTVHLNKSPTVSQFSKHAVYEEETAYIIARAPWSIL